MKFDYRCLMNSVLNTFGIMHVMSRDVACCVQCLMRISVTNQQIPYNKLLLQLLEKITQKYGSLALSCCC